jgi:SAM-dependent methyltransferase
MIELLIIMCCPLCKGDLAIDNEESLSCSNCCREYPILDQVPRFVPNDYYVDSFSFEWDKHKKSQLDSASGLLHAETMFFERTGLAKEEIEGKLILDAGCGIGRFSEVVKKYGGRIVGVDMSYAIDVAHRNVPGATIIQADIMSLPFKDESFDIIFSLGVIHHTYSTQKAFIKLAKLVKPGGKLAIWVYSNDGWKMKVYNTIANFYRLFTTRISPETLYKMSHIAVPLYYIHRIPVVGLLSRVLLSTSCEPIPEWRVLDTFDWYAPKYQFKHTYQEVDEWFREQGFERITNLKVAVSVQGTKI